MMSKHWYRVFGCWMVVGVLALPSFAADDEKPKYSIEDVMKKGFKKGELKDKVVAGEASAEEKLMLHEMFVALTKNEPHKGDAESWKSKTEALVVAAKAVVDGKSEGVDMLKKAANCKACHDVHK